ncbi:hypothetical protein AB1I68_24700 [Paenibacillus pabuli]|uniref:hypothetical protein n=1 Tax=Paenibacillus pabuli TaxID=1472 RepID=UPI0034581AB9
MHRVTMGEQNMDVKGINQKAQTTNGPCFLVIFGTYCCNDLLIIGTMTFGRTVVTAAL